MPYLSDDIQGSLMNSPDGDVPPLEIIDLRDDEAAQSLAEFTRIEAKAGADAPLLEGMVDNKAKALNVSADLLHSAEGLLHDLRAKSGDVCNHCLRVGLLAATAAEAIGADPGSALLAGLLHDIGKGQIAEPTLIKTVTSMGQWNDKDRESMNPHVDHGARTALAAGIPSDIVAAIASHHAVQENDAVNSDRISSLTSKERLLVEALVLADISDAVYRDNKHPDNEGEAGREGNLYRRILFVVTTLRGNQIPDPAAEARRLMSTMITARQKIMSEVEQSHTDRITHSAGRYVLSQT